MSDTELNRRELTGDDALRFARESGMERASETRGLFICSVGDLIRFARLVRAGWAPPSTTGVKVSHSVDELMELVAQLRTAQMVDLPTLMGAIRAHAEQLAVGVPGTSAGMDSLARAAYEHTYQADTNDPSQAEAFALFLAGFRAASGVQEGGNA